MLPSAVLLLGLLLQDPQKPQDPNRPQDQNHPQDPARADLKTNATIDPELRAAVDSLKRATGFKYHADGSCTCAMKEDLTTRADAGGKPVPPDEKVAHAKERTGDTPHDVRLDGTLERGKPIHVVGDDFEAYRAGDKIVYKLKNGTEWMLLSRTSGQLGSDLKAGAGSGGAKGDVTGAAPAKDDGRMVPMLARLPAPSELLDDLDSQIVSCTRVTGDRSGGGATFECVLKARAGGPLGAVEISAPPRGAPASATTVNTRECKLRITVKQGAIDDLTLESHGHGTTGEHKAAGGNAPARGDVDDDAICDMTCHYRISDVNGASVQIPEQVQRLLER